MTDSLITLKSVLKRIVDRIEERIRQEPDLAIVPAVKLATALCEEFDINPAVAMLAVEEFRKRKEASDEEDRSEE